MQKHIKFNIAKIYNKLGFDEQTSYLYCALYPGLKTVKGELTNPIGEQIYHEGDLVQSDDSWGIIYPSPYWIPAPYVFDIVLWLKKTFDIIISLKFDNEWSYEIIYPEIIKKLELNKEDKVFSDFSSIYNSSEINNIERTFISLEKTYEDAINKIAMIADKNKWIEKLYKYI